VLAARALAEYDPATSPAIAKRNLNPAVRQTAARLGNTPNICRKSYIHPAIMSAYLGGELRLEIADIADDDPPLPALQTTGDKRLEPLPLTVI
jgi:DNA topoisomerase-1